MGCQCLGPKKSQQEVFVKLLKEIYGDSLKISAIQLSKGDTFSIVYEKIIKKGQLKKLTDNLSSRKHKIHEAFSLNYKLVTQNKQFVRLCCGLIIINAISQIVYPKKGTIDIEITKKEDQSSQLSFFKNNSFSKFTQSSTRKVSKSHQTFQTSYAEIDEQYFKTIKYLIESDSKLKKKILENINNFCSRHIGFITCETQIWKLIHVLMKDINNDVQSELNCLTFKNLLSRTRDQLTQQLKNRQLFQSLLFVWLRQQNSLQPTQTKYNCFQILHIYLVRFISAWQSQFLYQTLFSVFDKIQFDKVQSPFLQKLFEDLVDNTQYQKNFQRNLFNYLLGYLSITQQIFCVKKWLISSLGIKLQNTKSLYLNASKSNIKIQCLKRMNAWIDKNYIDINQFCIYNSKAIIYVYVLILVPFQQQKFSTQAILQQFDKTVMKLSSQMKKRLVQTAIQQFYQSEISERQQIQILLIIKQLTKNNQIKKIDIKYGNFFVPLHIQLPHNNKKNIMKLNIYLLGLIKKQYFDEQINEKIIELLYSFYKNIVIENIKTNLTQKYQLVQMFLVFFRDIYVLTNLNVLIAYYSMICKQFNQNIKKYPIQTQFCILIYGFFIRRVLINVQIPDKLNVLRKKIQKKQNKNQCLPQINQYFFARDNLTFDIPISKINQQQFEEYDKLYKNCLINKQKNIQSPDKKQLFTRKTSMKSDYESNNKQSQDSSFQDVINFISTK